MALGSYRTCTYIAGDWDNDKDAVDQLKRWNESNHWGLTFKDVHELTSSRDTSKACSIKDSLRERMNVSKTFVLIVGNSTVSITKGSCAYCPDRTWNYYLGCNMCSKGKSYSTKSFVEYECELAIKAGIKIIVLYKAHSVDRSKCPSIIRNYGTHIAMKHHNYIWGQYSSEWDYYAVKGAFGK